MKKLFLFVFVLFLSSVAFAQQEDQTPAERRAARKAENAIKESAYVSAISHAIESGSFQFTAEYVSHNFGRNIPINNGPFNIIYVSGGVLRVQLPYFSSSESIATTPMSIDFTTEDFSYTFEKAKTKTGFNVKIKAENVRNNQVSRKVQNGDYSFAFEISASTGKTFVMVTPTFDSSISYTGVVSVLED